MSDHLWYYEFLSETFGPVSTDEIQELIAEGRLEESDRIRLQGSEDWISVSNLRSLVENVSSGEDEWEEVTDLDDLNFTFEDSSAGGSSAVKEPEALDDRHSGLDIDAFQLTGDPEEERHSAFASKVAQPATGLWMVQSLGQTLGPMPVEEVIGMAESGALSASDLIQQEGADEWVKAKSVDTFADAVARGAAGSGKPTSRSRKSTQGGSRKSSKSAVGKSSASAAGRKRRRKKKKSRKDALLAEIFADVFTEDGTVRDISERPDLANSSSPSAPSQSVGTDPASSGSSAGIPVAPGVAPGVGASSGMGSSPGMGVSPGMGSSPGVGASSGMGASPGMTASAAASAASMGRPAFVPPAKKKKRGGGGGLQMPEPPVLAAIGGVLLVGLLVGGSMMGWFTIPGFGVNPDTMFANFETEFAPMLGKPVSAEEWLEFRVKYLTDARAIAKSYSSTAGTDPAAAEVLKSALFVIKLLELRQEAEEARGSTFEKFKARQKPQ